jgi:hypothetical protein
MKTGFSFLFLIAAFSSFAQIPNNGFETWDSSLGYRMPVGWDNLNSVTISASLYACNYESPGFSGSYYMSLTSQNIPGMGVKPGIAVCGIMNHGTYQPISGFPYTQRPQVLAGYWQYMAMSATDQGFFVILLSKWNTSLNRRDTIAYRKYDLPDMVMTWQPFYIALNYTSSATPDSAIILMSASGATLAAAAHASYIWVDDLHFGDSATLGIYKAPDTRPDASIYPNPAAGQFFVKYYSQSSKQVNIALLDITGRTILKQNVTVSEGYNTVPVSPGLNSGIYFIEVADDKQVWREKLLVN